MESLSKAAVLELLETASGEVELALSLRQELAKSSVKKYTAMQTVVGMDSRARGLIQFYGANRTGRFAGRLIQVQNLPQNHLPDLEQVRTLVRSGQFEAMEMLRAVGVRGAHLQGHEHRDREGQAQGPAHPLVHR